MTTPPMRVLAVGSMYPPHHQGGYELAWRSADEHLRGHGHQVRVLTTDHREPGVDAVREDGVHRELRWYWRDHGWPRLGARERLRLERHNARVLDRQLEEFAPHVVAWWAMGGMSLSMIERVRLRGLPAAAIVCDAWLTYAPREDQWLRAFRRRPWLRALAGRLARLPVSVDVAGSARFLFLSEALREEARAVDARYGEGVVAHRGPDLEVFSEAPAAPWRWRLLYVGRLDPRKGIDVAIEAMASLPDATLEIAAGGGDAAYLGELREQARRLGVGPRVTFSRPSRDELQDLYSGADAVIFPVRWAEPWGLVPLEAMVVGRPVVATGIGGTGEYLEDGRNSLVYDADAGPEALAGRIRELAADERLRERLRAGGFATARRVSAKGFNDRVEDLLGAVADRRDPGSALP